MDDRRFVVVIIEKTFETRIAGKEWREGGGKDGEYGYTPEIEKTVPVEREVFKQDLSEIDLVAVIKAVNGI